MPLEPPTSRSDSSPGLSTKLRSLAWRLVFLLILWAILTEGFLRDPFVSGVAIAVTVAASYLTVPLGSWRLRPAGVLAFLPYFLYHSFLGGFDVARRAFHPALPLRPAIREFALDSSARQRLVLTWIISLLPGTASVRLNEKTLLVHVLDEDLPFTSRIRDLEKRIARFCE